MVDEQKTAENVPDIKEDETSEAGGAKEFVWGDGIGVDVSASLMSVKLEVDFEYAENYTVNDLVLFLEQQNNIHHIDKQAVESIFTEKLFNKEVVVAKGIQPKNGENGRVDWEIDLSILDGAKLIERGGRVDWKEQHHILQVQEDQLLARLIDPTMGESGENVYGQEIPATPGKEVKFPAGKGVRISEDQKEMYAAMTGVVCRDGDKISITEVYTVPGDVNFKTGNVQYEESIVVTGGVLADFKIHAGHDLHINGLVEGAELVAGGNIYINGGIQGNDKALVKAGGDVTVKFINNATVEARGDVVVESAITNSKVRSLGRIVVNGNKAVIVGGHVSAEKEISTAVIGSEIGVKTNVEIGEQLLRLKEQKNCEEKKIKILIQNHRKMKEALHTINKMKEMNKLPPDKEPLRLKLVRSGMQLQGEIKKMQVEIKSIEDQIQAGRKQQKGVAAREIAWPGTIVQIMGVKYLVHAQNTKVIFALLANEIELYAYKEGESGKSK
ncbi:MAG: DUF342 domain-containing protein [Candidatus Omnitrophota bacterium]|jgi:uncharacterized protein (DUF342 family)|nr:MAG: DUF342 domain-containing protein [Candidatus Omnitrophota bacterium]